MTSLLGGAAVGGALGAVYLGLLWMAVRSLPQDRRGMLTFVALGVARMALLIGALAAAAALGLRVEGIAAAVIGFVAARIAATRLVAGTEPGKPTWK
ncbi:N-ATPase subunit AtpR [Paracoccus salsus]|uniref:N-ATPase subunit AtpR n=1 Tax=Paracoccus salsus TaxID=2911061 RepID=UPI001F2EE608|nr:ATP synthase subunit I [Paracoccus salsus]MCF3974680.1 hypothetical protein [Paracoccus salsus]